MDSSFYTTNLYPAENPKSTLILNKKLIFKGNWTKNDLSKGTRNEHPFCRSEISPLNRLSFSSA
jgi:hypothetical protein